MRVRRCSGRVGGAGGGRQLARVLEEAEIQRLLMGLQVPGDGVIAFNVDPPNEVGLRDEPGRSVCLFLLDLTAQFLQPEERPYFAVNLELFHSRHGGLGSICDGVLFALGGTVEESTRRQGRRPRREGEGGNQPGIQKETQIEIYMTKRNVLGGI